MPLPHESALQLLKANLELQARLTKLMQESGRHWLACRERLLDDGIADSDAAVASLLQAEDWQKLAVLPADAFWRQLQQRFGDTQAMTQVAVNAQTAFAGGLQEALRHWQQQTAAALGSGVAMASQGGSAWDELLKPWQQWPPAANTAKKDGKAGK